MELNTALLGLGHGHFFSFVFLSFREKSFHFCFRVSSLFELISFQSQRLSCLSIASFVVTSFNERFNRRTIVSQAQLSRKSCFITSFDEDLVGHVERYSCNHRVNPSRSSVAYCLIYTGKRCNFLAQNVRHGSQKSGKALQLKVPPTLISQFSPSDARDLKASSSAVST